MMKKTKLPAGDPKARTSHAPPAARPLVDHASHVYGNHAILRALASTDARIHVDSERAAKLDAVAFTEGSDIHFAPGEWKPATREGRETLGHELTHVLQQRGGRVGATAMMKGAALNDDPALEGEADAAGRAFARQTEQTGIGRWERVLPSASSSPGAFPLQRQPKPAPKEEEKPKTPSPPSGGTVAAGDPLTEAEIKVVREALKTATNKRYIVYTDVIKVGGTLAWRANNPGNLRGANTKIARVKGGTGYFAVFATLEEGEAAQRSLYLDTYGDMKVRDAVAKLTPKSENDLDSYLKQLEGQGVKLDGKVKDQIDTFMAAVKVNEGSGAGTEIARGSE